MNAQNRTLALTALTEAAALSLETCAKQAAPMAALRAQLTTAREIVIFEALEKALEVHRHFAESVAQIAARAVDGERAS